MSGWGLGGGWGLGFWGFGGSPLQLLDAYPVRENVVRLRFSEAPYLSGIRDPHDGLASKHYAITPVPGTIGGNGIPTRPVTPVSIATAAVAGTAGSLIDVTVDRPFSPFQARYRVAVVGLVAAATGATLLIGATSLEFDGLYRGVAPPAIDTAIPSTDIANPQTFSAMVLSPIPGAGDPALLGSFAVDDSGDYALDDGIVNLKKRIYRRLVTSRGRFAHLPDYGVGVPDYAKRLSTASIRGQLAAEAERQIALEPNVTGVSVQVVNDPVQPSVVRFRIRVRAKFASNPIEMDAAFSAV